MHLRKIMLLLLLWLAFGSHATGQEFAPIEPEGPEKPELWVDFSIEGGFYNQDLRIELSSPGAQIYYTTDGNTPDPRVGSHKYTGPIDVSTTTPIRAIAVKDGRQTKPISHTYFIREPESNFPVVSIVIPPAVLFHPASGLFVKGHNIVDTIWKMPGANFWSKAEVPMNTEIFEADGTCVFRSGAGFRLFGGMSRLFPQKSITIVARDRYGQKRIDYPIFGKKGLKKYKFLVLRNSGSDFGKSHFRDGLMTSLVDDWDIDKQDYRPSQVYINGEYWGIYNIREKINRYFIAGHHDVDKDSIDLLEHRFNRKTGSRRHYQRLLDFLDRYNLDEPSNFTYVESQMEVDNFLKYQIAQIYFDNQDAGGNIRFWRPQTPEGRWRWILYDTDWGFGLHDEQAFKNNSLAFHTEPDGPRWPNPPWSTFLLRKLLENRSFEKAFVNRFCDYLNTSLSSRVVEQKIDEFQLRLEPEIPRHLDRWHLSLDRWYEQINQMRIFARQRPDHCRMHLMEKFDLGREREVRIDVSEGGKVILNHNLKLKGAGFEGKYFERVPIRLQAVPRLGYRFSHWEGIDVPPDAGEFTLSLTEGAYHIRAVFEKYVHPLAGKVMINEISANNRESGDWIELYNYSDETVQMGDWIFTDRGHEFMLPDVTIPPRDYLILCEDSKDFVQVFPKAYRYIGDFDFGLNKRYERLGLFSPEGALVDSIIYEVPPIDTVFTMNLLLPNLDNADFENWELLRGIGTPNAANRYYVESTIQARRELWIEIGIAAGVILLCIMLLALRAMGKI